MLKKSTRSHFIFTVETNFFRNLLGFITGILLARLLELESYGNIVFLFGFLWLGWVVNSVTTSLIVVVLPRCFTLFVFAFIYFFLAIILVCIMQWLVDMNRKVIYLTFNVGSKKLKNIF
jgi:hypothetical protein